MVGSFAILGLVVIVLGVLSARLNRRLYRLGQPSLRWRIAYRARWPVGILLAVGGAFVRYSAQGANEAYRIYGFPFLVAAFDSHGFDYVGPLSIPSFVANVVVAFLFAQIAVWSLSRVWQEQRPGVPGSAPKLS